MNLKMQTTSNTSIIKRRCIAKSVCECVLASEREREGSLEVVFRVDSRKGYILRNFTFYFIDIVFLI